MLSESMQHYPPDVLPWEYYLACKNRLRKFANEGLVQPSVENRVIVAAQILQVAGDFYDITAAAGMPTEIHREVRTAEERKAMESYKGLILKMPFIHDRSDIKFPDNDGTYELAILITWPKTNVLLQITHQKEKTGRFSRKTLISPELQRQVSIPLFSHQQDVIRFFDWSHETYSFAVSPHGPYMPEHFALLDHFLRGTSSSVVVALDQRDKSIEVLS